MGGFPLSEHWLPLLRNKLSQNLVSENKKKNLLFHIVSVGQGIGESVVGWLWLGAFHEVAIKMPPGLWLSEGLTGARRFTSRMAGRLALALGRRPHFLASLGPLFRAT